MAERVPPHRLAQIIGRNSLDAMMVYVRGDITDGEVDVRQHPLALGGPRVGTLGYATQSVRTAATYIVA